MDVLGIEAARQTIINEIQFTMSSHGMQIDPRHMYILADTMTFSGEVTGMTRQSMKKITDSTLRQASFEETMPHLYNAAIRSKKDEIKGVSESIIVGNLIPVGTGMFRLIHDEENGDISEQEEA